LIKNDDQIWEFKYYPKKFLKEDTLESKQKQTKLSFAYDRRRKEVL